MFKAPEIYRVRTGPMGSTLQECGLNGAFFIPTRPGQPPLKVIISDGTEPGSEALGPPWEHVSVSLPHRCPTWDEMCRIKALFWDDEDAVMELHPPRSQWISNHPYCLHLWRPVGQPIPMPPSIMVGYRDLGQLVKG